MIIEYGGLVVPIRHPATFYFCAVSKNDGKTALTGLDSFVVKDENGKAYPIAEIDAKNTPGTYSVTIEEGTPALLSIEHPDMAQVIIPVTWVQFSQVRYG